MRSTQKRKIKFINYINVFVHHKNKIKENKTKKKYILFGKNINIYL